MRHFLQSGPIAALTVGVGVTAAQARLITAAGGAHGVLACLLRTRRGAVAVAAITVAADDDGGTAAGAEVASSGKVHWQAGPMESRRRRLLRETLGGRRRPRMGLQGAASGLTWRLGPASRPCLHRQVGFLPHRRPGRTSHRNVRPHRSVTGYCAVIDFGIAAATLPLPRYACQTTIAAQFVRRKPYGRQGVKPACSCLKFKTKNQTPTPSRRHHPVDAKFLRKLGAANKYRNRGLLNQIKQAMCVCEGLFAHDLSLRPVTWPQSIGASPPPIELNLARARCPSIRLLFSVVISMTAGDWPLLPERLPGADPEDRR